MGVEADELARAALVAGSFERGEQLDEQLGEPPQESRLGRFVVPDGVADGADNNMGVGVDWRDFNKICPPLSTLARWCPCRRIGIDARLACCPEPFARRILGDFLLRCTRRLLPLAPEDFSNRYSNCSR